jgi:hypothetical protein
MNIDSSGAFITNTNKLGELLAPILFFHRRQLEGGWVEADHLKIHPAVGADNYFTLHDVIQGNFGITFGTMSN